MTEEHPVPTSSEAMMRALASDEYGSPANSGWLGRLPLLVVHLVRGAAAALRWGWRRVRRAG